MKMNNSGFTLVQVIVSIGIMAILGLALATMMTNSFQQEARLALLLESREFSGEFLELSKSPNCGIVELSNPIVITDRDWKKTTSYDLNRGVSGRFMKLKRGDKYGSMTVEGISIAPYVNRSTNTTSYVAMNGADENDFANATKIKANLKMEISSTKGVKAPLQVPIYLYINPGGGRILSCENAESNTNLAAMCTSMSGQWDESSEECTLPCPAGMDKVKNKCVSADQGGDSNYCSPNEKCDVDSKYIF